MAGRRNRHLRALRKQIAKGRYRVDPYAVADAILLSHRPSSAVVWGAQRPAARHEPSQVRRAA